MNLSHISELDDRAPLKLLTRNLGKLETLWVPSSFELSGLRL